ncbi:MAG: pyridoxamine 5'-phosphate oxidase family protein [Desulfofustis sp.]|nr:pyridoxamine 5'-phosphate oxidase family protein [Desulfofustis sp.]MBT8346275.1 pyridoxamine 5'-phosphate oxidase family protein [Desulfofustis sp.]NNK56344.1 pyridoxamine 5'-phosphate oxidase family protein [Desulfofustis sp.]RZW26722.1 MAG: pyridoxamine 5'-phosphate oxidase family protein [Desulfobulbaceae bacterium]
MDKTELLMQEQINDLLSEQPLAVLSTQRNGQPYSSLMAFAHTRDLGVIVVATGKSTRKYQNIIRDARVSLLVDNRSNNEEDFHAAAALTVLGVAKNIESDERQKFETLYLERHPYLQKFLNAPTTSFIKIEVQCYLMVSRFQNVMEYRIGEQVDLFS